MTAGAGVMVARHVTMPIVIIVNCDFMFIVLVLFRFDEKNHRKNSGGWSLRTIYRVDFAMYAV